MRGRAFSIPVGPGSNRPPKQLSKECFLLHNDDDMENCGYYSDMVPIREFVNISFWDDVESFTVARLQGLPPQYLHLVQAENPLLRRGYCPGQGRRS